jgi:hypothetical protein
MWAGLAPAVRFFLLCVWPGAWSHAVSRSVEHLDRTSRCSTVGTPPSPSVSLRRPKGSFSKKSESDGTRAVCRKARGSRRVVARGSSFLSSPRWGPDQTSKEREEIVMEQTFVVSVATVGDRQLSEVEINDALAAAFEGSLESLGVIEEPTDRT